MARQRIPVHVLVVLLHLIASPFLFAQSNDNFADRATLAGPGLIQYGDGTFATREPLEPPGRARSLWWSWTAPADGLVNIRSVVFRNVECSVWTGDSLTNLVHVATANFDSYLADPWPPSLSYTIMRCEVEAGQTYQLRFALDYFAFNFDFGFSLDLCGMQITNPAAGVFNGPTNMPIEVTPARSDIEGAVTGMMVGISPGSIYGHPGSYATPLSGTGPFIGTITNLLPGIYSLTAWGTNSAGRFISTRSVPVRVAPCNDNFASASSIRGWVTNESFWVDGSSTEDGEPEMDGQTNRFSVWWKWTATSNSTVLIRSHVAPIAVFEGDSLASLRPMGSRLPYAVRLDAVAATTYYIRAATDGPFSGLLNVGPLLANDDFANSILLAGDNVTFMVTNSHTSIEPGESSHVDNNDRLRGSLWWHWIAQTNGLLFLEPLGERGTYVEVFSGSSVANLARQAAVNDPPLPFDRVYRIRAGEQFNFAFDGTYDSTNRPYRVRFIPDPPPDRVGLIRLSPREVCFVSQAEVGEEITIEASQNLEYWFAIDSEIATETTVYLGYRFAANDDYMFFRAVRLTPSAQ
jgi:hypothetical protein